MAVNGEDVQGRVGNGPDAPAPGQVGDLAVLATVESSRERLRVAARSAVGVTGKKDAPPLREAIALSGVGWYPLFALGALVVVDEFQNNAIAVLGPEIAGALGISRQGLVAAVVLRTLVSTLAVLPFAALVQRRPRRAVVAVSTAFVWSLVTIATGFVVNVWELLVVMVATSVANSSVQAVHRPLLLDTYPPEGRLRSLAFYRGANAAGLVIGPLIIFVCTAALDLTWRGVMVGLGVACFAAAVFSVRLRDPGFGRWDTERIREIARQEIADTEEAPHEAMDLGFFEIVRRLMLVPTVRRLLGAFAVLGMFLVPFTTYLAFFLHEEWGLGPAARSAFLALMSVFSIVGLAIFSRKAEALYREDPERLVSAMGSVLALAVACIALGLLMPVFVVMVALVGIAFFGIAALQPALSMTTLSIIPARMRPHMAALNGLALAGVGGTAGLLLLSGVDRRFGVVGAMLSLAVPGIAGGLFLRGARATINDDLDRMIAEIIEAEEIRGLVSRGVHLPMLACRNIAFSYGQLQVLFDVNLTVDDGEIVALLGTNGAGKSTLLRVISGIGLPTRGSVRFEGTDITYVDAERRVRLGISQVPGGRAVYGPLTVMENLRIQGYSHGRNRRAVDAGIEATFDAFPRLAERRNHLASMLSGGEQQMLALGTAFVVKPRLLLIDELSLGLAPNVVSELLEMVRTINAAGTAIVLVEQSVNVALAVVEHAYFMEKGQIRFDGQAKELLRRPDLLRSVFLEGATQGQVLASGNGGRVPPGSDPT